MFDNAVTALLPYSVQTLPTSPNYCKLWALLLLQRAQHKKGMCNALNTGILVWHAAQEEAARQARYS